MNSVSVIIPVYQVSDYVERCLKSLIGQTYTAIECIIVDDVTLDDSIEKCEKIIAEYHGPIRFRILHHEVNRGLSAARNTGTKAATGEYVYFFDSDDEITPDCIDKLMKAAQEHPDAVMVMGNAQTCKNGIRDNLWINNELPCQISSNNMVFSYYLKRLIPDTAWNKLIKREFIEEHGLEYKEGIIYEDYLWMYYMVKYLSAVYIVKDVTYYYHVRLGSILTSPNYHKVGISFYVIYDNVLHHLTLGREDKELRRFLCGFSKRYLEYKKSIPAYRMCISYTLNERESMAVGLPVRY